MHLTPWAPGSNLAVRVNRAINDQPGIQQEAICYQWFKQRLILSVSKPNISQRSQIKDTVKPSVPAREFNLKAYAAITRHNDRSSLGLEPRLADHRSQAARTAMLPTAPPRQAISASCNVQKNCGLHVTTLSSSSLLHQLVSGSLPS